VAMAKMTFLCARLVEAHKRQRETEKGNGHPVCAVAALDMNGFLLSGN
jgi:hypothetical protein